jgi:serine/threonine-protein kinase
MSAAARYARKQALVDALAPLSGQDRHARLERDCADDAGLREEVLALLAATSTQAPGSAAPGDVPLIGKLVDRYRILRLIGEGGMGAVFLAERTGDFSMHVALKLIRGATPALVQRFTRERQILASLQHPGIARLYDGGTTDDGTPYLVMEYVDGLPLLHYAAQQQLGVEARLALFAKVCDAVAYAHQNLVIHRDIKPGNVLVNAQGQPKLLDFGIAALQDTTEGTALTVTAAMTPAYASPEQILQRRLTAATDQYSLGVLMYELLTGLRPFAGNRPGSALTGHLLPDRPSQAVTRPGTRTAEPPPAEPRRLRAQLAGDLDAIVLRALRAEPDQRYATVSEFAADIRRHLAREPVLAQPPSRRYVLGKFLSRHRAESAAAALLIVGLAAAAVFMLQSWRDERAAHAKAQQASEETAAINDFLLSMLAAPDPRQSGREVRVVEVLAKAAQTAVGAFPDRPLVRARLLQTLGDTYSGLGLPEQARPLLRQALTIYRTQNGPGDLQALEAENDVLEAGFEVDPVEQFQPLVEDFYRRVRKVLPETQPLALTALNNLGTADGLMIDAGHAEFVPRALQILEENLRLRTQVYGEGDKRTSHARNNYANVLLRAGRYAQAEQLFRQNLQWQLKLFGHDNYFTLGTTASLANALRKQGHDDQAIGLLREAVDGMQRVQGPDHPVTLSAMATEAEVLYALGQRGQARSLAAAVVQRCGQRAELADLVKRAQKLLRDSAPAAGA